MRSRAGWVAVLIASVACVACGPYYPPFSQAPRAGTAVDPHQATLVFLWPETSCDPAGYFTLVTADGRFVGSIGAGKQLRAQVPAGETTVVGWNAPREEVDGAGSPANVPVLRARLAEGRTYYVRMLFGEWDETGPARPLWVTTRRAFSTRWCTAAGVHGVTSAMVALTPASESWNVIAGWTAKLAPIAPDLAAGQAWVNGQGEALRVHIAQGELRYEGLRPEAKRMATMEAGDGVDSLR